MADMVIRSAQPDDFGPVTRLLERLGRPTVTPRSDAFGVGITNSLIAPSRSMRPSALVLVSTNQIEPSGCVTMARGWLS